MDDAAEALQSAIDAFYSDVDDALQAMLDELEGDDSEGAPDLRKIVERLKDAPMEPLEGGSGIEDLAGWVQRYEPQGVVDLFKRNGFKL